MSTFIKMIWTGPDNCIFIYGITPESEVVFRSGRNIKYLQVELVHTEDKVVYFGPYNVPKQWLEGIPAIEVKS